VVFRDPELIEMMTQTSTGSVQLVPATLTMAGDKKKLVRVINPAKTATGGTARALLIWTQPCRRQEI